MLEHAHYDVIVAGAGPAGTAFARTALKRDPALKIAIIEKYKFPRDKICGDGLTFLTMPLLRTIFPEVDLSPHASPAEKISVRAPFGRRWYQFDQRVDVIPRRVLDHELVRAVRADGIEIAEETQVTDVLRDATGRVSGVKVRAADGTTREINAQLVVGADGSSGIVRRKTGSVRDDDGIFAIRQYCRNVPLARDGLVFDIHVEDDFGYFWFFPFTKDGERWGNIGYGGSTRSVADLKKRYEAYLERPEIAPYVKGSEFVGKPEAFPINLARLKGHRLAPARSSQGPGYVLVGDAAGIVHPYSGEGISFALESGRLAAEAYIVTGARAFDAAGPRYERALRERLKPTHQVLPAYMLLKVPALLPKRWVRPYLDGTIGAIRTLRKLHPQFLNRDLLAKGLQTQPSALS